MSAQPHLRVQDRSHLDGREYVSHSLADAVHWAQHVPGQPADTLEALAQLALVPGWLAEDPDPRNDLDFGPDDDEGIDWAEVQWPTDDDRLLSTSDLVTFLSQSPDRFTRVIGQNVGVLLSERAQAQYTSSVWIVDRRDGADLDSTDLSNVSAWR